MPQYVLIRPKGRRRSFGIQKRERGLPSENIEPEALQALNKALKAGLLLYEEALQEAQKLLRELRGERPKLSMSASNKAVFEDFWRRDVSRRKLKDPYTMKRDYIRALEALGGLSILSASADELQTQIDSHFRGNAQRRRMARLSEMLSFLGRGEEGKSLRVDPADELPVRYLTAEEMTSAMKHQPNPVYRLICWAAWGTGARLGEIFGLGPDAVDEKRGVAHIRRQMYRKGRQGTLGLYGPTKTGRRPKVPLLPAALSKVIEWAAIPEEQKIRLRGVPARTLITAPCIRAFPARADKHLVAHNLRDSYAIACLRAGLAHSSVARAIGDNPATFVKHYADFIMTDEEVDDAVARLRRTP